MDKKCERDGDNKDVLRTGDRCIAKFRFKDGEYILPNRKVLIAEGQVKIIGKIIKVYEEDVF